MTDTDPQSADWGGIGWSQWHDLDHARDKRLIPQTAGLYRFRSQGEDGLLYIGESSARWTRLDDLARARHRHAADYYLKSLGDPGHSSAPYFMLCEEAGCKIEVSWALDEDPDRVHRQGTEARLLRLYRKVTGEYPLVQHGGKGVGAYLKRRGLALSTFAPKHAAVTGNHQRRRWIVNRYTVDELREEAEAYLEYRRSEHPATKVSTDRNKIKLFLDWFERKSSASQET